MLNPPLDENDIPLGEWICHSCRVKENRQLLEDKIKEEVKDTSTESLVVDKPNEDGRDDDDYMDFDLDLPSTSSGLTNERDRRAKGRAARKLMTNNNRKPSHKIKEVFDQLIQTGELMNPVTFDPPMEYKLKVLLPGDDKVQAPGKLGVRRTSSSKKKPHELDHQGLVPLPAKLCFTCGRTGEGVISHELNPCTTATNNGLHLLLLVQFPTESCHLRCYLSRFSTFLCLLRLNCASALQSDIVMICQLYIKNVMVYTYRHREAVLGLTSHSYSTRAAVGGGVWAPVIEMTVNLTNAYYVANSLYRVCLQ
ncbi:PHD finger protein 12 [Homalodisca vitripennis]|nr:PHD finger protein 12 [Homalodisca vitripennis]